MKRTGKLNKKLEVVRTIIRPLTTDQLGNVNGAAADYYAAAKPTTCMPCYTSVRCA